MSGFRIPQPKNEPVHSYAPGSPERAKLKKAIEELKSNPVDIPSEGICILTQRRKTGKNSIQVSDAR